VMTQTNLLAKIDAAKKVISAAEKDLQRVEDSVVAAPAEVEVSEVSEIVQVALSRVKAAKAELIDLERLLALAKIEAGKIEAAKTAIIEAEKDLDRVLGEILVVEPVQERLVTEVVADAFTKLKAAKSGLADLEKSIVSDKD
jgi:hypothetical protein